MPTNHILLVDDHHRSREALADLLGSDGYRIDQAGTGAEAVKSFCERAPDIIVSDYSLPDGPLDTFVSRLAGPPLIVVSGTADLAQCEEGFQLEHPMANAKEVHAFFPKPLDYQKLLTTLLELREGQSHNRLREVEAR